LEPEPGDWVVPVPGAICDRVAPGDPSERVALEAPLSVEPDIAPLEDGCVPTPGPVAPPCMVPPVPVPGAICCLIAPGDPSELVAEAAPPGDAPGLVVLPAGEPLVPVLPVGAAALPPGVWSGVVVPGAAWDRMAPGEPSERVVSAWLDDCATAPPAAIRTHAVKTAVLTLFISGSSCLVAMDVRRTGHASAAPRSCRHGCAGAASDGGIASHMPAGPAGTAGR
jgi:hypothetical protein